MKAKNGCSNLRTTNAIEALSVLSDSGAHRLAVLCHFGSGQASFVTEVLRILNEGPRTRKYLRIRCQTHQVSNPFFGFVGFLDEWIETADFAAVVRAVDDYVGALMEPSGQRILVLVEDGQYLDPESAYVLTQMVQAQRVELMLCNSRPLNELANLEPLAALGPMPTVVLGPLSPAQTAQELGKALGKTPTAGSVAAVQSLTGGIYELLLLLMRRIDETESWEHIADYALIRTDHLLEDNAIHELIWFYLRRLDDQELDAVVGTVLAGGYPGAGWKELCPEGGRSLIRSGLVSEGIDKSFFVSSRLIQRTILSSTPPSSSLRIFNVWQEFAGPAWVKDWHAIWWALSVGSIVTEGELALAARQANDQNEFTMGLALASVDLRGVVSVSRDIQRIRAAEGQGLRVEARNELESLATSELTAEDAEELTKAWMIMLGSCYGDLGPYRQAARAWAHIAQTAAGTHNTKLAKRIELAEVLSEHMEPTERSRILDSVFTGSVPGDVQLIGVLAGLESLSWSFCNEHVQYLLEHLHLVDSLGLRMHLYTAMATAEALGDVSSLGQIPWTVVFPGHGGMPRAEAALVSLRQAWQEDFEYDNKLSTSKFVQAAADFSTVGMHQLGHYCATNAALREPALDDATGFATLADGLMDDLGVEPEMFKQVSMLGKLATLHADPATLGQYVSWLLDSLDARIAIQGAWHVYRDFEDSSRVVITSQTGRIAGLVGQLSSPRLRAIGMLLASAGRNDLTGIQNILMGEANGLAGIESVAWATVLLSAHAQERERIVARKGLYSRSGNGPRAAIIDSALQRHGLSTREFEIASYAAIGMSNKQISTEVNLSVRTVEGHLYRSFQKLGIQDREELGGIEGLRPPY
ncbi:helix-turn-helix transcriptional regulator [Paeniglutamicibacter antarcticus]|uniref:HTH luxR-type domain-containing protein n=1 Tax=Paeniglutamicibacter antarcticus TaxID=494023 RepID=A0ABP9TNQ0_9MICC